jgi:hypothetical protein
MLIFKTKLHRITERHFKLKKNSLKKPFETLKLKHGLKDADLLRIADECGSYCEENKTDYVVSFNMYVSCLNNPKKIEGAGVQ